MFIFGKIKTYIIAALTIALPILYIIGRVKGSANEQNKVLKDDLQAQEKAKDFYKAMSEHEKTTITDRDGLTDRLRGNGL